MPAVAERDPAPVTWSTANVRRWERSAAPRHAALIENTSPAPITATAVDTMAATIPIQRKE